MKRILWAGIIVVMSLTACQQTSHYMDNVVVARVGETRLTKPELRAQMPSGMSSEDSIAFVREYVKRWVDHQLLYQLGLRNVNDLKSLESLVEEYRQTLIAETYEKQLLASAIQPVSEEECQAFYEKNTGRFKLKHPIVQGIFIRVPLPQSQLDKLKSWLKSYLKGKTEVIEEMENFCLQRATAYDNFSDSWVNLKRLVDLLPPGEGQWTEKDLEKNRILEYQDEHNCYILVITDVRRAGEIQPFGYAVESIRETLTRQKQRDFRSQMRQTLFDEGVANGTVVIY